MITKIKIVCDTCGNDDLEFDSTIIWNFDLQKFKIVDVGEAWCHKCNDRVRTTDILQYYPDKDKYKIL
jgi:hypothetical protein